jgi:TolB-like protein/Tfp pilus assembly protein PilF
MAEERVQRRLAAILAADVVGYSRMMQADEAGTMAALKSRRTEILQPLVSKHHGRIIKFMGDGVLVEFGSAVEAVGCAVALQEAMAVANEAAEESRRVVLRIGINLGDVMVESGDLYGDGVNIAARLEGIAEPGRVLVSQTVYGQVRGKVRLAFEDVGEQKLKNMEEPVRAYRVSVPARESTLGDRAAGSEDSRASIAILPLANMSGDTEQEYFSDGLTEDLITALAKSRELRVLARNTTFQYKNQFMKVQQVGRELGVRYVVEGSVRRSANRIRVTAQLIDCDSGAHLWAERFDRELTDTFAIQDEIVEAISAQLGYALIDAVVTGRRGAPTVSLTAYDYLLRGRSAWRRGAAIETRDYWLKAVEADPNYATALACLAFFYAEDLWMQTSGEPLEKLAMLARDYAKRAIAADDGDAYVHHQVGSGIMNLGKLKESRHHLELALSLNPYNPNTSINLGCAIALAGQHREGLEIVERVLQLEPRLAPSVRGVPFYIKCLMGDLDGAKAELLNIDQPFAFQNLFMAAWLASAGREEEARLYLKLFEDDRSSWFDVAGYSHWVCTAFALPEDRERFRDGLRKLGYSV